jgi:hypothetical protein
MPQTKRFFATGAFMKTEVKGIVMFSSEKRFPDVGTL